VLNGTSHERAARRGKRSRPVVRFPIINRPEQTPKHCRLKPPSIFTPRGCYKFQIESFYIIDTLKQARSSTPTRASDPRIRLGVVSRGRDVSSSASPVDVDVLTLGKRLGTFAGKHFEGVGTEEVYRIESQVSNLSRVSSPRRGEQTYLAEPGSSSVCREDGLSVTA
jgi:hypothetical protein